MQTVYTIMGDRSTNSNDIHVDGKKLDPVKSRKIRDHSPDGFNWGYGGSGPAQAALAICLEIFKKPHHAQAVYQDFKFEFVSAWKKDQFVLVIDLTDFIARHAEVLGAKDDPADADE